MVALVKTAAYLRLEDRSVEVQCQVAPGLPRFGIVGLPDKAVSESRERVQSALAAMGLALPPKRITINLSPADLPKDGSHYDLPIALALLAAMGVTDAEQLGDWIAVGELALDGRIVASPGVLLAALHASETERGLICPAIQGTEAKWASGVPVLAAPDLVSLLNHLKGTQRLPEFQRPVLDSLRQPLETGSVDVARANAHVTFPARVQLVAAMNPCRCGHLGDPALACSRAPRCAADHQNKVSGPMLDRIDLHVEVDPVSAADMALPPPTEGSAEVAARMARARAIQTARAGETGARSNAELNGEPLEKWAKPDEAGQKLLLQAAEAMRLSARGYTRMLRVARTIADLAGAQQVGRIHIAEALSYRRQAPRA